MDSLVNGDITVSANGKTSNHSNSFYTKIKGCVGMKGIVDRFEGNIVVIEIEGNTTRYSQETSVNSM